MSFIKIDPCNFEPYCFKVGAFFETQCLKQFQRAGVPPHQLLHFYTSVIRPVLGYASPVWHYSITRAQSSQLKSIQQRALVCNFLDPVSNFVFFYHIMQCFTIITVSAMYTCISFCIYFYICYSPARLCSRKCEIKLGVMSEMILLQHSCMK